MPKEIRDKKDLFKEIDKIKNRPGYKAKLSEKGLTIDFDKDDIINNLPNLAKELLNPLEGSKFSLNEYSNYINNNTNEKLSSNNDYHNNFELDELQILEQGKNNKYVDWLNSLKNMDKEEIIKRVKKNVQSRYDKDSELYNPKTEDFLRRCSNNEEALEIIEYQLKMKEISLEKYENLKKKILENGVRFFGTQKLPGYYERQYRNK